MKPCTHWPGPWRQLGVRGRIVSLCIDCALRLAVQQKRQLERLRRVNRRLTAELAKRPMRMRE